MKLECIGDHSNSHKPAFSPVLKYDHNVGDGDVAVEFTIPFFLRRSKRGGQQIQRYDDEDQG